MMPNIVMSYLFFVYMFFCSCSSVTKKNTDNNPINQFDTTKLLNEDDSLIVRNCVALVVKSDTVVSETGCSQVINCYNKVNKVIIHKSRQICLSDTRVKWGTETYFNEVGDKSLVISFDGLNKILQIERFGTDSH